MGEISARTLGERRGVRFKVAQIDVLTEDVELLVVGMFEHDGSNLPTGGANQLDTVFQGTLSRLREGGIFKGTIGETLMLSTPPPPIKARALMLIGMGGSVPSPHVSIGGLTELAMRTALRMDARSAGCLLAWSEREIPSDLVEETATAMMEGALKAIEEAGKGTSAEMDWIFDIRNGDATRTANALEQSLKAGRAQD
ncbi:MAG: peptidase M17 [Novosphingobium sp. SCN 66-18]|nr:MAG: peptidase M17 [Novosphingobium sp. SCN 66-18]